MIKKLPFFSKLFILIGLYILLHIPIETFFNIYWVNPIAQYIKKEPYYDIVIIVFILIFTLYRFLQWVKGYIASIRLLYIQVLVGIVYLYYRNHSNIWQFSTFYSNSERFYTDVILWLIGFNIFTFIVPCPEKIAKFLNNLHQKLNKNPKNKRTQYSLIATEKRLFHDEANKNNEIRPEVLGYSEYAAKIVQYVQNNNFDTAFAIGINAPWGYGKTSFLNLLEQEFRKSDRTIVVEFPVWRSQQPNLMLQDFFETLQDKLQPYYHSLPFGAYSRKLLMLKDNAFAQLIQVGLETFNNFANSLPLSNLFDQINEVLEKIDRKLIILIDDTDRLNKSELPEILKLIRNTANFCNTFFVVTYDRNYLISNLRNEYPHKTEKFLDKIFQLEINLPYFNKNVLTEKLKSNLKAAFIDEGNSHKNIDETIDAMSDILLKWLQNLRDVTRLSNGLSINLCGLINDVYLHDFILLEILRIHYPAVYELLHREINVLFEKHTNTPEKRHKYELIPITDTGYKNKIATSYKRNYIPSIYRYLAENTAILGVPNTEEEIGKIVDVIGILFQFYSYKTYNIPINRDYSIVYCNRFYLYFSYNLMGKIAYTEFLEKFRTYSPQEFEQQLKNWIDGSPHRFEEIIVLLTNIKSDDEKEQEKILKYLLYIVTYNKKDDFDRDYDFSELFYYISQHIKNDVLFTVLDNAPYPYIRYAHFISEYIVFNEFMMKIVKEKLYHL